jgi:hypothetical protein
MVLSHLSPSRSARPAAEQAQEKTCVMQVMLVFRPCACHIGDSRGLEAQLYLARG